MRKKITKRTVDAIEPSPTHDVFLWDTELRGFGVRVKPSGSTAFLLSYYAPGLHRIRRRLTIGVYGPMTVDQAREKAKHQLGTIAHGADPAQAGADERRRDREETIAVLFARYLADQAGHRKARTLALYQDLGERFIIPRLGPMPIRRLTTHQVADLHRELGNTGKRVTANHVGKTIRTFWNWCAKRELVEGQNPASKIDWYPEQGRERFLTPAELTRLGAALRTAETVGLPPAPNFTRAPRPPKRPRNSGMFTSEPRSASPVACNVIRFLALSGWRKSEALSLRWDAVDFAHSVAVLNDTKTGRSARVLSAPVLQLLAAQPQVQDSPYVFPGKDPTKPLREFVRTWYAVRHAAGLDDVRLHDLRHSLAAIAAGRGLSLPIIQRLLGHKDTRSTARYAHLADDVRKMAADDVSEAIHAAMAIKTVPTPLTQLKAG